MHIGRDVKIPIAFNDNNDSIIVSPAYLIFCIINEKQEQLLPEYLLLVFQRYEFDRYCWFATDSSIRGNLQINRFYEIEIPLPPIEIQKSIAAVAHCLQESRRIVQESRELMKNICPALVQKAAHSA